MTYPLSKKKEAILANIGMKKKHGSSWQSKLFRIPELSYQSRSWCCGPWRRNSQSNNYWDFVELGIKLQVSEPSRDTWKYSKFSVCVFVFYLGWSRYRNKEFCFKSISRLLCLLPTVCPVCFSYNVEYEGLQDKAFIFTWYIRMKLTTLLMLPSFWANRKCLNNLLYWGEGKIPLGGTSNYLSNSWHNYHFIILFF